jgi:hypothetical protein
LEAASGTTGFDLDRRSAKLFIDIFYRLFDFFQLLIAGAFEAIERRAEFSHKVANIVDCGFFVARAGEYGEAGTRDKITLGHLVLTLEFETLQPELSRKAEQK